MEKTGMVGNTHSSYGLMAVLLHWLMAITVFGLFALGLWMVELTYYDPWYRRAPWIHKSIGVLLFAALLLRLFWRGMNSHPEPVPAHSRLERWAAGAAHALLYVLLAAVMISGYLISTADGKSVNFFGWFSIPATVTGFDNQEDIAGDVHLVLAITLVSLAALHALAALKHHFLDRDPTLIRMLGRGRSTT
jgi:cytochrome b561